MQRSQTSLGMIQKKEATMELIKNDMKITIDRLNSGVNDPDVSLDRLLLCGDAIRQTQENFDSMSHLLKQPQFKFNSQAPLPTEPKLTQLKKVLNQKVEKATIYSTAIYMYLLKCKDEREIDQIFTIIAEFYSKLSQACASFS
ncbi:hypothetical protein SAMD00019534_026020 [Acytostelium subglobosum LB1]|uniref:hypothetical protein n=1 Tax=Acytostelium subglobosum LB1 TaxID=1410327 RepID=UPI000644FE2C|nr:hypothetical protein SAMD00019534_026020 [Acytostelium subglobosum LB1]GAM19427.1 hypothetical protein SAMD00019534_026020 [Acytostelium subglobosum LB1]|eukprot:XP_012757354.1 hypothetical protein SAMD00019534_026020 [Acytostelium subglobosum LB1]